MSPTYPVKGSRNLLSVTTAAIQRYVLWTIIAIGSSLLLYSGIRAATVSFTFDEIYSLRHVQSSGFHLYPAGYEHMSANDHWLNSFFVWVLAKITTNIFVLRIPQLISHALFLFFSARIIFLFRRDSYAIAAFILINLHPYLLDFFSLARGYGLSLGCMMTSLYFLLDVLNEGVNLRKVALSFCFAALAVSASFVLLNFFAGAIVLLALYTFLSEAPLKFKWKVIGLLFASAGLVSAIVLPHLLRMQKAEALYFGSEEFWSGTARSITDRLMYFAPYTGQDHFESSKPALYVATALIFLSLVSIAIKIGPRRLLCAIPGSISLLTAMIISAFFIQAQLFNTLYPLERTGLFLLVLYLLTVMSSIGVATENKKWINTGMFLLCLPVLFHFFYCMNITYVMDWKQAGNADEIFSIIEQNRAKQFPGQPVSLSSEPVSGYSTQFVADEHHADWLTTQLLWVDNEYTPANYYIVEAWAKWHHNMTGKLFLYRDEITGNEIYVDTAFVFQTFSKMTP